MNILKRKIPLWVVGLLIVAGAVTPLMVRVGAQPVGPTGTPVIATSSAIGTIAITPSDTVNVFGSGDENAGRAITIDNAGTIHLTFKDGTQGTFGHLGTGAPIPYSVKRVWSTGTTATGISVQYKQARGPLSGCSN